MEINPKLLDFRECLPIITVGLGERINKSNQFHLTIPMNPNAANLNDLLINPRVALALEDHSNYFYGIENQDVIAKVWFYLYNYQNIYKLPAKLTNGVWRLTSGLLPLMELLEYSEQMKLEVEIELNTQKKRFYNFNALYVTVEEPIRREVFCLSTCDGRQEIRFIGKIWTVIPTSNQ